MKKSILGIITLVLLSSTHAMCQLVHVKEKSSFYMGKRGTLDINLLVQPSLQPGSAPDHDIFEEDKYDRKNAEFLPIYTLVSPEMKYTFAISNKFSAYVNGNLYSRSKLDAEVGFYLEERFDYEYIEEYGYAKLKGRSYGLGFQWFQTKKAALAPMGFYIGVGAAKHDYTVTHEDVYLSDADISGTYGSYLYKLDNIKLDFSYASLNFEIGNTQPLSKLVYYKLALSSSANIGLGTFGNNKSSSRNTVEGYLLHTARQSLTFNNIFVLKMGLGLVIH